jgi:hypothetical protein
MRRRLTLWAALLVVALVVLAGCAPRAGTPLSETFESDELYIDLPAVVIDFNEEGQAFVGGVSVANLGSVAGMDLSALSLDPSIVNFFTLENIQHLQVVTGPDGLTILVNGLRVPSLVWDEGSLVATADAVRALGIALPVLDRILPLVQQFGLGITLTFPVAEGNAAIPLGQVSEGAATSQGISTEEFLSAVGTPPRINLPVVYDEQGNFTVGDLTGAEWTELTGAPFSLLQLTPEQIQSVTAAGLTSMSLETTPEGLLISVNDQALPTISWGEGELQNVLELPVVQDLLANALSGAGMDADVMDTISSLLPIIQASDANLTVFFPGSEMGN